MLWDVPSLRVTRPMSESPTITPRVDRKRNIRVVIEPKEPWMLGSATPERIDNAWMRVAEEIRSEVRRHVDGEYRITIQHDRESTCSFCGYAFDVSEKPEDEPACCDEAVAFHHQEKVS